MIVMPGPAARAAGRHLRHRGFGLRLCLALCLGAALIAPASGQDFRRGLQSYNVGDYVGARNEWRPLAEGGDPDAQAGLAYLYLKGLGVGQDYTLAIDWYSRSAEQGQPGSQFILGTLYFYGDGIQRDLVLAYAWCELAQANGEPEALECRQAAERRMTAAEVSKSLRFVTEWFNRHTAALRP